MFAPTAVANPTLCIFCVLPLAILKWNLGNKIWANVCFKITYTRVRVATLVYCACLPEHVLLLRASWMFFAVFCVLYSERPIDYFPNLIDLLHFWLPFHTKWITLDVSAIPWLFRQIKFQTCVLRQSLSNRQGYFQHWVFLKSWYDISSYCLKCFCYSLSIFVFLLRSHFCFKFHRRKILLQMVYLTSLSMKFYNSNVMCQSPQCCWFFNWQAIWFCWLYVVILYVH